MKLYPLPLAMALLALILVGCEQQNALPTGGLPTDAEQITDALSFSKAADDEPNVDQIAAFVDDVNAKLAAGGSDLQLDYPWMFRIGQGTDPFARLRTGSRWTKASLSYVLDESDYTGDVAASDVDAAFVSAFDSWNDIARTYITTNRAADTEENPDLLDGFIVPTPEGDVCLTVLDLTSPSLVDILPGGFIEIDPVADILVGGFIDDQYFDLCLGSSSIIGVTWTLSTPDQNGDGYRDIVYVEELYNERFNWTTEGSIYLDFSPDALTDIETIVVHEHGHALGLGHFGGPVNRQPFKLKPNGRVFNPEAVMNPFYIGGEERTPLPTDVAGLTTLYTGHVSTTN